MFVRDLDSNELVEYPDAPVRQTSGPQGFAPLFKVPTIAPSRIHELAGPMWSVVIPPAPQPPAQYGRQAAWMALAVFIIVAGLVALGFIADGLS